jgi:hypothetical protein
MDPITTAVVAQIGSLALEAGKDIATGAFKSLWTRVKDALGWKTDPENVEAEAEKTLAAKPELLPHIQNILKNTQNTKGGVNIQNSTVQGDIKQVNVNMVNGDLNF